MRFPVVACVFVCVAVLGLPLCAQSPNGNINGLVSDPTNAAVAEAEIIAANDVTGVQYTTRTNAEGIYVLPNLPPGPYRVQVSKIGFKTLIKPDIVLNIQDSLSINFTLPLGAFHEVITVQGGAPLVNTESAAVSTVIDQTYVENMPLNGRSFQDLILLAPGVETQSPQIPISSGAPRVAGQNGEFSVNGQRAESNYYTVDGVSANVGAAPGTFMTGASASGSVASSTTLGTTQALVSVDALQEFRVQSSTYSAEYGRNPGGQFAFETKSGTNQWHGTAYDYLRNNAFDANDWFNDYFGVREPALHQNDFGGTFGGPVSVPHLYNGRDKTFFFASYEGLRLIQPQAATASLVPDIALRTSAPTPLNGALNAFPMPSPNGLDFGDGIAQYIGSWSDPSSLDSSSVRCDHVVTDRLKLFFRFADTRSRSSSRGTTAAGSTPTNHGTLSSAVRTYTAGATSLFSTHLNNDLRLNYSSADVTDRTVIDAFGGGIPIDLVQLTGLPVVGLYLCYDGCFGLSQSYTSGAQRQWNLVDTVTLVSGRHQFKFGIDYRRLAPFAVVPSGGSYYFLSESGVQSNGGFTSLASESPADPLYVNFSAFAQDKWNVSPRLTVSLGLRWDLNPAPGVARGLKPYTIQGSTPSTWALAPQGTPLWQTTWYNFAPRLGVAYLLHNRPGRETVVRGGGGVFFDTGQQVGSKGFYIGPGFSAIANTFSGTPQPFPIFPALPAIVNPPVPPVSFVTGFPAHLQLPYTLQWNVSLEQGLGRSQALTFSYVGSHASRLLKEALISPTSNPNIGTLYLFENGLTSDYDALQVQFRRRLSSGLTALASYTWSHCLDYGSQDYAIGYQRGSCDFDVRQNLSTAISYDLPSIGNNGPAKHLLRNWGIDDRLTVRTAFPVTLDGLPLFDPAGELYTAGLNLVPSEPVNLYGSNCATVLQGLGDLGPGQGCPGGRAINPLAFTSVSSGYGNAPRNFVRGFGAWQTDVAVRREFPIRERMNLQLRAEAFNIFNHPNFGTINSSFGESTFGQATATLASSLGVLNPLYQMGGPRSMQFALRIVF